MILSIIIISYSRSVSNLNLFELSRFAKHFLNYSPDETMKVTVPRVCVLIHVLLVSEDKLFLRNRQLPYTFLNALFRLLQTKPLAVYLFNDETDFRNRNKTNLLHFQ